MGSFDWLNSQLDLIEKQLSFKFDSEIVHDELKLLTLNFIEILRQGINIGNLEKQMLDLKEFDTSALQSAIDSLKQLAEGKTYSITAQRTFVADSIVSDLQDHLNIIKEKQVQFGSLEIGLRLELDFDLRFNQLLCCLDGDETGLDTVLRLVLSKLSLLDPDTIMQLWGKVQAQFQDSITGQGFNPKASFLPTDFLGAGPIDTIRQRIAAFIVRYRPQLIKDMAKQGSATCPAGVVGLGRILAIKDVTDLRDIHPQEAAILGLLSKLVILWEKAFPYPREEILKALGVPSDGFIASGEVLNEFEKQVSKGHHEDGTWEKYLILHLRKLANLADALVQKTSGIEKALWNYKLGLEVLAPISGNEILAQHKNEERLQRDLCKFLVERDIQAFGTKFGRSEIDILLQQGGEKFVVETKLYKRPITERQIKKDLVQLLKYLDQGYSRGALLIFNLSDVVIHAHDKWINGRAWIVGINLGQKSPSKANRYFEIESSNDQEHIRCWRVDPPNLPKSKGIKNPRRGKKKKQK